MSFARKSALVLVVVLGRTAAGQHEMIPAPLGDVVRTAGEVSLDPAAPSLELGFRKTVFRNDYAHFQFYPGFATAYFTLWHRASDPNTGCTVLIKRTYLSRMLAVTIDDPHKWIWANTDPLPHQIEWGFSKQSCDGDYFAIYYRRPGGPWQLYGLFERDYPN
ncbi:MAG TPA: hypothetical protein VFV87_06655 [Pirellulaceae bacterium]|nr:hypothetical protein [Pirellulaceae bacterium]